MANYNGTIASLIKGSSTGGENAVLTGISTVKASNTIPQKMLKDALIAVYTTGVSGTYAVEVVCGIGGGTFTIAGATGIAANGTTILGASGTPLTVPRPAYVAFSSAKDGSGFTATVSICGEY